MWTAHSVAIQRTKGVAGQRSYFLWVSRILLGFKFKVSILEKVNVSSLKKEKEKTYVSS